MRAYSVYSASYLLHYPPIDGILCHFTPPTVNTYSSFYSFFYQDCGGGIRSTGAGGPAVDNPPHPPTGSALFRTKRTPARTRASDRVMPIPVCRRIVGKKNMMKIVRFKYFNAEKRPSVCFNLPIIKDMTPVNRRSKQFG